MTSRVLVRLPWVMASALVAVACSQASPPDTHRVAQLEATIQALQQPPTSTATPEPTPTDARIDPSNEHLSAARDYYQARSAGLSLSELDQALAIWPENLAALELQAQVKPYATAQIAAAQQEAIVQATTQAREAAQRQAAITSTAIAARATQARAATATASKPNIIAIEGPTYPTQARVGASGVLRVKLRNDGVSSPKEIKFQISSNLFDGFLLRSAVPNYRDDHSLFGDRFLTYAGIAPGQEREYVVNLVGKTTGEYRHNWSIYADQEVVGQYSGRTVVLP